jgi:hypothetical protein
MCRAGNRDAYFLVGGVLYGATAWYARRREPG